MSSDHWHFRRVPFTQNTFAAMINGPSKSFTLFGPRRTGKTEWLRQDLGRLAADHYGHRVAYASLWETRTAPLNVLLYRLSEALQPRSWSEKVVSWAGALPIKARIKSPDGTAEVELDLTAEAQRPAPKDLLLLDSYCQALANTDQPAILMFDEFQELANHPDGPDISSALRTALDTAGRGLVSIFTGSSMEGLKTMFSDRDAPFFNFATPIVLEPLGDAFLDHQINAFRKSFARTLDPATARAQFETVDGNPELFQRWLNILGQNPNLSPEEATRLTDQQFAVDQNYFSDWRRMSRAQRQFLRLVADDTPGLFGKTGAERIANWSPDHVPDRTERQSAQRWLDRNGFIEKTDGRWTVSDPAFGHWIQRRPDTELQ